MSSFLLKRKKKGEKKRKRMMCLEGWKELSVTVTDGGRLLRARIVAL